MRPWRRVPTNRGNETVAWDYFGSDWFDPLENDVTVNSGRLGPTAVELVALAAGRFWERTGEGKRSLG